MSKDQNDTEYLKAKGHKALILNIIFFLILSLGIFLVSITGFAPAAIIIFIAFIVSMVYIYYYLERRHIKK